MVANAVMRTTSIAAISSETKALAESEVLRDGERTVAEDIFECAVDGDEHPTCGQQTPQQHSRDDGDDGSGKGQQERQPQHRPRIDALDGDVNPTGTHHWGGVCGGSNNRTRRGALAPCLPRGGCR